MTDEPKEIVMYDDPRAAFKATLTWDEGTPEKPDPKKAIGWVCRHHHFFQKEDHARYSGCTHKKCETLGCESVIDKSRTICEDCWSAKHMAEFDIMPEAPWDGKSMVYSGALDKYFSTPDDAVEYAEEEDVVCLPKPITYAGLRLINCVEMKIPELDAGFCEGSMPDDGDSELPDRVVAIMGLFNAAVEDVVLGWEPGETRVKEVS